MSNPFATPTATPAAAPAAAVAPEVPEVPTAPVAPEAPAVAVTGEEVKERKTPAKQMTGEQIREVIGRAEKGETPSQIAESMGLVRNQTYRAIKTYKDRIGELMEDPATPADKKVALQAKLDAIPAREFGAGGTNRGSTIKSTLDDLLAGL